MPRRQTMVAARGDVAGRSAGARRSLPRVGWLRLLMGAAVVALLGALVGVFGVLPALLAKRLLHPPRRKAVLTPRTVGLSYEPARFTGHGVTLTGWYVPSHGEAAVVLLHGFGNDRTQLLSLVPALHAAGYHTLLYDMRARGESGGACVTFGHYEADDLAAAVAYLRERSGARHVAAVGVSLGAAVAVLAAARGTGLDAVVADSAFADLRALVDEGTPVRIFAVGALAGPLWRRVGRLALWHAERWSGLRAAAVRPLDAAGRLSTPILFIHGLDDRLFSHRHSVTLHAAVGGDAELWLVPEADHVGAYDRDPAEYTRRLLVFLAAALGDASAEPPAAGTAELLAVASGEPPVAIEVLPATSGAPPGAIEVLPAAAGAPPAPMVLVEPRAPALAVEPPDGTTQCTGLTLPQSGRRLRPAGAG